jgi:hypothetical protein
VPIVLQKSPRRGCRIEIRNNRIDAIGLLNQCCALAPDLESILRARMRKIVLQHNRPLPDSCTAAKQKLYSITSSAIESSDGGTVRPSSLAVCALMTSSNLLDCTTGRSAGLAPLRRRPT